MRARPTPPRTNTTETWRNTKRHPSTGNTHTTCRSSRRDKPSNTKPTTRRRGPSWSPGDYVTEAVAAARPQPAACQLPALVEAKRWRASLHRHASEGATQQPHWPNRITLRQRQLPCRIETLSMTQVRPRVQFMPSRLPTVINPRVTSDSTLPGESMEEPNKARRICHRYRICWTTTGE